MPGLISQMLTIGADLDVELSIRTEGGIFPIVVDFRRQLELVGEIDALARIGQLVLDIVVARALD